MTNAKQIFSGAALSQRHPIVGEWDPSQDGSTLEVRNPATGALVGAVPAVGVGETHTAISTAAAALRAWRSRSAKDRAGLLIRWAQLLMANQKEVAEVISAEQGKPMSEAMGEVAYGASYFEWFAEQCKRVDGEILQAAGTDRRMLVLRQPIGVCAAITPWNFPLAMLARKVAPALAAGCTIIVKPAEQTPLTAYAMANLGRQAGVPEGVLQVISGDPVAIGGVLCASDVIRKLSFTGSTAVGRLLMRQCSDTIKKLSLELGGNAPFIIFSDADIDQAIEGVMASKFRNSGQTCVCANRIYVQDEIYDRVAARLTAAVEALQPGEGSNPNSNQGPLIDEAAIAKVEAHIEDAVSQGARVLCGGKRHALGGTFFEPTVVSSVSDEMLFAREETFGPVAPLFRFQTESEVLERANNTVFGLAAYVYTRDNARIWRVSEELECGMVGVNTGLMSSEIAPFGGVKQSGLGREGSHHGIEDYLELKYVCVNVSS